MNTTFSLIKKADAGGLPLLIARILLGGTFIYMGVHKVLDPVEFLKLIRQYEMVPESPPYFLNGMAVVFPWLEIVSGTALLLGMYVRGSVAMMAVMLCVFTPVIFIRAMHIHATEGIPFTQVEFDCGCGAGVVVIWTKLLENIGFFAVAVLVFFSKSRKFCLDLWFERRRPDPMFCHLCGYAVQNPTNGLCERCVTPPDLSSLTPEPA